MVALCTVTVLLDSSRILLENLGEPLNADWTSSYCTRVYTVHLYSIDNVLVRMLRVEKECARCSTTSTVQNFIYGNVVRVQNRNKNNENVTMKILFSRR